MSARWKDAVRKVAGANNPATLATFRLAGRLGRKFRGPLLDAPRPWLNPDDGIMVVWSAKCACTTTFLWFLNSLGRLDAFRASGKTPHRYRAEDYYPSETYRAGRAKPLRDYWTLHVIRDPFLRAVSSYRQALGSGYADKRFAQSRLGSVDRQAGFSFSQFLDYLQTVDLAQTNIHHKLQLHRIEARKWPDRIINISRQDLIAELDRVSLERNVPRLQASDLAWLTEREHRRMARTERYPDTNVAGIRLGIDAALGRRSWPDYHQFLDGATRRRIETLYARDFEAFAEWL
jgi:hypothetical protein